MLIGEVLGGVHTPQHLHHAKAVKGPMAVPDRVENLFRAVARGLVAFVRLDIRTEFAFQITHMPRGKQLRTGTDAQIQVARRLFGEGDAEGFRDLLWIHGEGMVRPPVFAGNPRNVNGISHFEKRRRVAGASSSGKAELLEKDAPATSR